MLVVHAYIDVTEAARGVEFYCGGLGLAVKRRLSLRWIELAGANIPIFLLADRPAVADLGTAKIARNFKRHWTPVHLDFIVGDLDRVVSRLTALGGSLDREIKTREYGRIANMADPLRQRLRPDQVFRIRLRCGVPPIGQLRRREHGYDGRTGPMSAEAISY